MNNELQRLYELLYWQALGLAKAKRYAEAEMLLANFEQADATFKAKAYDLKGRMLIQQKQYAQALALLQQAVALDPENTQSRIALEYLPHYERRIKWIQVTRVCVVIAALVIGAIVASNAYQRIKSVNSASRHIQQQNEPSALSETQSGQDFPRRLPVNFSELPRRTADQPPAPTSPPAKQELNLPRWPELRVTGIQITTNSANIILRFDKPVFVSRLQLSESATQVLSDLAVQVKPILVRFQLIIVGHTDSDPISDSFFKNNYDLGYARAIEVAEILRADHDIPSQSVMVSSAGSDNPLFPAEDPQSKAKNRTVVIKIIPRQTIEVLSEIP